MTKTYVTLTKYGAWVATRRRLVAQIAGRPGWTVQETKTDA